MAENVHNENINIRADLTVFQKMRQAARFAFTGIADEQRRLTREARRSARQVGRSYDDQLRTIKRSAREMHRSWDEQIEKAQTAARQMSRKYTDNIDRLKEQGKAAGAAYKEAVKAAEIEIKRVQNELDIVDRLQRGVSQRIKERNAEFTLLTTKISAIKEFARIDKSTPLPEGKEEKKAALAARKERASMYNQRIEEWAQRKEVLRERNLADVKRGEGLLMRRSRWRADKATIERDVGQKGLDLAKEQARIQDDILRKERERAKLLNESSEKVKGIQALQAIGDEAYYQRSQRLSEARRKDLNDAQDNIDRLADSYDRIQRIRGMGAAHGAAASAFLQGPEQPFSTVGAPIAAIFGGGLRGAGRMSRAIPYIGPIVQGMGEYAGMVGEAVIAASFGALERTWQTTTQYEQARMGAAPFVTGARDGGGNIPAEQIAGLGYRQAEALGLLSTFGQTAGIAVPGGMEADILGMARRGINVGAQGALARVFRVGGGAAGAGTAESMTRLLREVIGQGVSQGMDAAEVTEYMSVTAGAMDQFSQRGFTFDETQLARMFGSFTNIQGLGGVRGIRAAMGMQGMFEQIGGGGGTPLTQFMGLRAAFKAGAENYPQAAQMLERGMLEPGMVEATMRYFLGLREGEVDLSGDVRGMLLGRETGLSQEQANRLLYGFQAGEFTPAEAARRAEEMLAIEVPETARTLAEIDQQRIELGRSMIDTGVALQRELFKLEQAAAGASGWLITLVEDLIAKVGSLNPEEQQRIRVRRNWEAARRERMGR